MEKVPLHKSGAFFFLGSSAGLEGGPGDAEKFETVAILESFLNAGEIGEAELIESDFHGLEVFRSEER